MSGQRSLMTRRNFLTAVAGCSVAGAVAPVVAIRHSPLWTPPFGVYYRPTPKQLAMHVDPSKSKFIYGGRGVGKTDALVMEVMKRMEGGAKSVALFNGTEGIYTWLRRNDAVSGDKWTFSTFNNQADLRGHVFDLYAFDVKGWNDIQRIVPNGSSLLVAAVPSDVLDRDEIVERYGMSRHSLGWCGNNGSLWRCDVCKAFTLSDQDLQEHVKTMHECVQFIDPDVLAGVTDAMIWVPGEIMMVTKARLPLLPDAATDPFEMDAP